MKVNINSTPTVKNIFNWQFLLLLFIVVMNLTTLTKSKKNINIDMWIQFVIYNHWILQCCKYRSWNFRDYKWTIKTVNL